VSVFTDTTSIRIGEQIQYKILVNETDNVIFPELKMDSLGKVEVVESLPTDTLKNKLEKRYLLTSFDSGRYIIPKQQVLINNKKFFTDSLLVDVAKVKVDTTKQKMFPIKSIKREPKTFEDYKHLWWWIIPILLLIAAVLYFVFRKKEKKAAVEVYIAPIQEAMMRLKELDEKQLLQQNKIKPYYTELTDIVRTYLEKDVSVPALESTTNELIETIIDFNESSNLGIAKETIQQLKEVLQGADLVKFAKSRPMIEEIRSDRHIVEEILKNTEVAVHENDEVHENNATVFMEPSPKKKIIDLNCRYWPWNGRIFGIHLYKR
jgi:cbb3-type cytochrome oxidase subunit 3